MTFVYPKRLIEVDLPIKRISAHARREKDMRRCHIPMLHIYPAARPPAACRAVICAALWPDPADPLCPMAFRKAAAKEMTDFAKAVFEATDLTAICDGEAWKRYGTLARRKTPLDLKTLPPPRGNGDPRLKKLTDLELLRELLLDFVADFANWDASTHPQFLKTTRALTQTAHEALGGEPGSKPLVVDPFAGGGAIPLEAMRSGADAFASDLNPVAVLINRIVLGYVPRFGQRLSDEIGKWAQWVNSAASDEIAKAFPKDDNGNTPIAYLWARTVCCQGPGCGAEIPLLRSLWLARKGRNVAIKLIPRPKARRVDIEIVEGVKPKDVGAGTIAHGAATCPVCQYTTPIESVRRQIQEQRGGAANARLFAVVTTSETEVGRQYRIPTKSDMKALEWAEQKLRNMESENQSDLSLVPDEPTPKGGGRGAGRAFSQRLYGMNCFGDLFTPRQTLALVTYAGLCQRYTADIARTDPEFAEAVNACLALIVDRLADLNASLCGWQLSTPNTAHVFVRWALQMIWDFGEVNPLAGAGGSPESAARRMVACIENLTASSLHGGTIERASAEHSPLPDDCAQAIVTDPPYYDAVPYSDLLDYFYVWLRRSLTGSNRSMLHDKLCPKDDECIVDEIKGKDPAYFEGMMKRCLQDARRVLQPNGIAVVVFAHKSTSSWERLIQSIVDAGWIVTGSWPVDTEMQSRLRARDSAALASSVHLVCRPRERSDGTVGADSVGDWREVLLELPLRIHEWMPRLAEEGIVGADAIFACLGPALEIFSRNSRVEKANGERVSLTEYLEHVWAAVAQEALKMVFEGADAIGFEEDARLTAMWLWTLFGGIAGNDAKLAGAEESDEDEDESSGKKSAKNSGFVLEYDAARKIAQGLGAHLEELPSVIEVQGDKARLLPVSERTRKLFGKDEADAPGGKKRKKKSNQAELFGSIDEIEAEEGGWGEKGVPKLGETVLDRVHQSMILFAAGRSEAIKRFLVEEGVGRDGRFWKLAQALSALYPPGTDEKRWVDGVLARKKGLGF